MMKHEVTFIREVVNGYGRRCEMPLRTISIRRARSRRRAVAAAIKRFERMYHRRRWDLLAHDVRVEEIAAGASIANATGRRAQAA
jgi:hypothetical protein